MMRITVNINGKETSYTFSDADLAALKNDLIDVAEWVGLAVAGKVHSCKERMCDREWLPRLRQDPTVTSIPTSQDALVDMIISRPDYMDRAAREELEKQRVAEIEAERARTATMESKEG